MEPIMFHMHNPYVTETLWTVAVFASVAIWEPTSWVAAAISERQSRRQQAREQEWLTYWHQQHDTTR